MFPMDLLKSFAGRSLKEEALDDENIELSLGLSSNGRFGVPRPRARDVAYDNNKLIRASSIVDFSNYSSATDDRKSLTLHPLVRRTCSLPIETEEEWKKRKELQSLRRSKAKRKRVEKLKNGRMAKGVIPEENHEIKRRNLMSGKGSWPSPPPSLLPPLQIPSLFPSQMSVESPASGGSSGISDSETNKDHSELKSTASQQPILPQISSSTSYRSTSRDETLKMMFDDMPCVSTKGDGVNGKKIEGFLYRYRKGEEARIVCLCHGSFLTPAEFVKHGGGGDVEHPLRHILVVPPSF